MDGSESDITRLKLPSNISILLLVLSAAYRKFPEALLVIARPV
jgi:hypothetical protein